MSNQTMTFPGDLGIAGRVGLTGGVGVPPAMLTGPEAEMNYRQSRLLAEARRREVLRAVKSHRSVRRVGARRTTWLLSALKFRSSPAPARATNGC